MPYKDPLDQKQYAADWYVRNKKRANASASAHYKANKDKFKVRVEKWKKDNPEKVDKAAHKSGLKKIGWTPELFSAVESAQGEICAICKRKETDRRLSADHDHINNTPRGLLCSTCNPGLGLFKDSPILLEAAAAYLRKYGAQ